MTALRTLLAATLAAALLPGAFAQPASTVWPARPIRFVLPSAPGGTGDKFARVLARTLEDRLGQPLLFDYRQGFASNVGMEYVAKAPADGYTLLLSGTPLAVNPSLFRKLPFDPAALSPVSLVAVQPYLVVVTPSLPVKTMQELVAWGRAHPGKLSYSSPGFGSGAHLAGALINEMAGVAMVHVPYKSAPQALTDVIGGTAQVTFTPLLTGTPLIREGQLRAIAVTSLQRSTALPDLPTVAESGFAGYDVLGWYGVMVPTGTPRPVIDRLNSVVVEALRDPETVRVFALDGIQLMPGSPEDFAAFLKRETANAVKVVGRSGAKLD